MSEKLLIAIMTLVGILGSAVIAGVVAIWMQAKSTHVLINSGLDRRIAVETEAAYQRGMLACPCRKVK